MRMKTYKPILPGIVGLLLTITTTATAAISPTNDTFQTNTESFPGWSVVLTSTNTVLLWDAALYDYVVDGGTTNITGDGLLNDHGLRMDTKNAVIKDEAIGFTLSGTMDEGETITFSGNAYNDNTSYIYFYAQIWNLTDNTLLAESAKITVQAYNNVAYTPLDFSVAYTATAADAGDTVQIRLLEEASATSRDIYLDNFSVTSADPVPFETVPEWNFDLDSAGTLATDIGSWDYTSRQIFDAATATSNTLAFNGKSTATDYSIVSKGTGHETALEFRTVNTATPDFGIYLTKLDFGRNGINSTNPCRVSWSFDILGTDSAAIDPTNWTVKINYGNSRTDLTATDASYADGMAVTAQTFNFVDDDATWTTVTGSYVVAAGQAGSAGGIQISTDNGGYTSADAILLDNIQVTVDPVVTAPAATELAWNFDNDGPTGSILTENLARYDYTRDTEYVQSNATVNTLAFNGRSTGTDYIIRDKGGEHSSALFLKTVDTGGTDFGIYVQKLDMTMGGQSVSNITRVSWSFDILGYDSNGALAPSNWTVKVQSSNTDPGLNVSDAWYGSAALAQTFDFFDDSTGETSQDGTWTTVTGSYDVAVGSTGTVSGIQISTDNGGYTSAGGIFLDNIRVTLENVEVTGTPYDNWAAGYGLTGSDTNMTADVESDGLNNLLEYALGGNPTNDDAAVILPKGLVADDGGTNYLYYVHNQRTDDASLTYTVGTKTNLVLDSTLNTADVSLAGESAAVNNIKSVTNRTAAAEAAKFIGLTVEKN